MIRSLCLFAAALLMASCSAPSPVGPASSGSIRVGVALSRETALPGDAVSRAIVPDFAAAVDEIRVTLTSDAGYPSRVAGSSSPPWAVSFTEVLVGSWDISVAAFRAGIQIGSGAATDQSLVEGSALVVQIPIAFAVPGQKGALSFSASFPDAAGIDYASGQIEEGVASMTPAILRHPVEPGRSIAVFELSGLDPGIYSLVLSFRRGGAGGRLAGIFREKVTIKGGFTSDKWVELDGGLAAERVFAQDEFYDDNANLSGLVAGSPLPAGAFSSLVADYARGAIPGLSAFSFTATASAPGQYLRYAWNGSAPAEIASGTPSATLALEEDNELRVLVTAPDRQTEKTYSLSFSKGYHLCYDGNSNTGGSIPVDLGVYRHGQAAIVAANAGALLRAGWTFAGWNTNALGAGAAYQAGDSIAIGSGDGLLYAHWIQNCALDLSFSLPAYRQVYFSRGGARVSAIDVVRSASPLTISYSDDDSSVSGWAWYLDGGSAPVSAGPSYSVDIGSNGRHTISCTASAGGVLYAGSLSVTVGDPLILSYDGNGADSGAPPASREYRAGDRVAVAVNAFARSGFSWLGWATDPLATDPAYFGTGAESFVMGSSSLALYAIWEDTPPSSVSGLAILPGNGRLTLSWTPPAEADFAGIAIDYAGDLSGRATVAKGSEAKTIFGLTNGTTYTFTIRAFDSAANYSLSATISGSPEE